MRKWKSLPTEDITCWTRKQNWYLNADTKTNTRFPSMTQRTDVSCIVRNHYIVTFGLLIIFGWRLLGSHHHETLSTNESCIISNHYSKIYGIYMVMEMCLKMCVWYYILSLYVCSILIMKGGLYMYRVPIATWHGREL